MKPDLSHTSFIIHYRKDHDDRFYNFKTILNFLETSIISHEVIIINDDKEMSDEFYNLVSKFPNCKIIFYKNSGVYKRPLAFKKAAKLATGSVLCFYDVDVLIEPIFLKMAQDSILLDHADHVYPYNGTFINILKKDIEAIESFNFETFKKYVTSTEVGHVNDNLEICSTTSFGGVYLISKPSYIKMGEHDERFIGWGFEDNEFYNRSKRFNRICRVMIPDAFCWHINHQGTIRMDNPHLNDNFNLTFNS